MVVSLRNSKIGILGGGQLARMLAEPALRLGLKPVCLTGGQDDPAVRLCPESVFGAWDDPIVLKSFLSQVSGVVFENEFIPCDALEKAAAEFPEVKFFPEISVIRNLQDKLRQKETLARLGIPSAPHLAFPLNGKPEDLPNWIQTALTRFQNQCVFKWSQLGYDGRGTLIFSPGSSASEALQFCSSALAKGVPLYAERKVDFKREVAVLGCLSVTGEFQAYPLVISEQKSGICRRVMGPATALGVTPALEQQAHALAEKLARDQNLVGVFAVEMFETVSGELLVNELAPRVHNTGHYSQDAAKTSQFENHWRAILGLGLGSTATPSSFAMLNLLGPEGVDPNEPGRPPRLSENIHFHWYGKLGIKAGRKLGHLNAVSSKPHSEAATELPELLRKLEDCESEWLNSLKKT